MKKQTPFNPSPYVLRLRELADVMATSDGPTSEWCDAMDEIETLVESGLVEKDEARRALASRGEIDFIPGLEIGGLPDMVIYWHEPGRYLPVYNVENDTIYCYQVTGDLPVKTWYVGNPHTRGFTDIIVV